MHCSESDSYLGERRTGFPNQAYLYNYDSDLLIYSSNLFEFVVIDPKSPDKKFSKIL